jgi:hypothetical protein
VSDFGDRLPNHKGKRTMTQPTRLWELSEVIKEFENIELQKRIIDLRDQILAHSDLTVMEAKVYVEKSEHGKSANIVQNVILGTEEFENIDAIINLIEQSRDSMYEQEKILEAALPWRRTSK